MKKIYYSLFVLAALVFIVALYIDSEILAAISKPIPLIMLLLLVKPDSKYNKLIFVGFIFSLFGDVFLMKVVDNFILGLASFLIGHVFYVFAFLNRNAYAKLVTSIPFYLLAAGLAAFLYPYLGELLIPVFAYVFVIMTMVWRSFLQIKSDKLAILAFIGAVLFAFSDSCIAFNMFYQPFEWADYLIITTYWAGQFLIYLSTTSKAVD